MNVKMPTIVGILTFSSMINAASERLEARNFFIYRYFSFYEQLKFRAHLTVEHEKMFYNLGTRLLNIFLLGSTTFFSGEFDNKTADEGAGGFKRDQ